jgi:hypothetical protein
LHSTIRIHSSLMMEAVPTSETSVDNNFTRQYIPEDNSEHQIYNYVVKINVCEVCGYLAYGIHKILYFVFTLMEFRCVKLGPFTYHVIGCKLHQI